MASFKKAAACGAILAGALLAATPALAQSGQPMPPPARNYAAMGLQQLAAELRGFSAETDDCTQVVPVLGELIDRRPDLMDLWPLLHGARTRCAFNRAAFVEALGHFQLWEQTDEPYPPFGLYLAGFADDGAQSFQRLEAVLLSGDEDMLASLVPSAVFAAMRAADKGGFEVGLDRIAAEAFATGAFEHLNPDLHTSLATDALSVAVADQDSELAASLLPYIQHPMSYVGLLASREFAPIWPELEARAGPNFEGVTSAYAEATLADWEADGEDTELLRKAAYASYFDGDFAGTIALVDAATARENLAGTLTEGEAWALNLKAYSLDALGRRAEADRVFDMIGLGDAQTESFRVNFAINRGSRLVGQGRWQEGLAAAEYAAQIAEEEGTPYALSLTLRDRICALNALGREDEIAALLDRLRVEATDSPGLLAEGLLCLNRDDEAAALLTTALQEDNGRDAIIEDLQDEAFDMFYTRSILPKARGLLNTHPALLAALLEHARLIPEEFRPTASLSR